MKNEYNSEGKDIRFIDSHYQELFRIPDGGSIRVTYADGESEVRKCTYIDDYHTQIGNSVYHICEFAEKMERINAAYKPEPEVEQMIGTNMGKMPIEDFREIYAMQLGFNDYADMRAQGICIGNGLDSDNNSEKEAVIEVLPDNEAEIVAFLESSTDSYAIFQLREDIKDNARRSYTYYSLLQEKGMEPEIERYKLVYRDAFSASDNISEQLEELYEKFNLNRPEDFTGHSMSVRDIVALKIDGKVSCHFVDSVGFKELSDFLIPENYLKNAEMTMEDDYGMIDGIINNGKSATAEERPSVRERLKEKTVAGTPVKPPRSNPERGMER